jgi:trk system potassium uptake protein TrkA
MNIVIVGCGNVGYALSEQLIKEGHEITLVDTDAERLTFVVDTLDIQGVAGNGVSYKVLKEAGVEDANLFIAVTNKDEVNMLGCLMATKIGKNCKTIARVRSPQYYEDMKYIKEELGLSMYVNPELEAAREISRLIQIPSAIDIDTFDKSRMNMIKFKIPEGSLLDGIEVRDIKAKLGGDVLVSIVQRGEDIVIPNGLFKLNKDDIISVITPVSEVYNVFKKVGIKARRIKNVMIAGGGRISYYLAQLLIKARIKVKIIESDRARCEELSELLPEAMIICGNIKNQSLMLEEGIHTTDAFVSVTEKDEENIMLSLYASKTENIKVITKIKNATFEKIVYELNLGSIVDPKSIVAEGIVSYVRALQNSFGSNVETLYKLIDKRVEALEFGVNKAVDGLVGVSLKNMRMRDNMLVCSIKRNGKTFIPEGKDTIELDDKVIVVTTHQGLNDIKDILR